MLAAIAIIYNIDVSNQYIGHLKLTQYLLHISEYFLLLFIYLFLERREGREKERERNINMQLLLICPLPGTWPTTQACALTGNLTRDPFVLRLALNLLSHTSQGSIF